MKGFTEHEIPTDVDMLKLSLEEADVEMSAEESDLLYHAPGKRQTVFED
ncbi:MAG: hypothetical protein II712_01175 [Erysipelotrichaceae bacterium]|nr:hypothetical protein [Erysipelotrichaceae bacterium]